MISEECTVDLGSINIHRGLHISGERPHANIPKGSISSRGILTRYRLLWDYQGFPQ
jgi:hypothetical protein